MSPKGIIRNQPVSSAKVKMSQQLRRNMTPAEREFWQMVRDRKMFGLKFRRQHPIGPYVVDFYCHGAKLAVEVDGMSHDDRASQDNAKTKFLQQQGLRVLRVTNEDVMRELDAVTREIARLGGVPWD